MKIISAHLGTMTAENLSDTQHVTLSLTNLTILTIDPVYILQRFVSMDEAWVHHFTSEAKQQFKHGITLVHPATECSVA
jgi:hypothetical protein